MQIDLAEIRKFLPAGGGHMSFEFRDDHGRLVASAKLDLPCHDEVATGDIVTPDRPAGSDDAKNPPGPNFLSIIS